MNSNTLGLPQHVNHDNLEGMDLKKVKRAISSDAVEGCEISGSVSVNRVPGKLVLTARSKEHSFDFGAVNVTHRVNHFSFGQIKRSEHLLDGARKLVPSERYPLDNKVFYAENDNITVEHFMNVRVALYCIHAAKVFRHSLTLMFGAARLLSVSAALGCRL